jgi:hypothetical protein
MLLQDFIIFNLETIMYAYVKATIFNENHFIQ